jgi:hypothetical protein
MGRPESPSPCSSFIAVEESWLLLFGYELFQMTSILLVLLLLVQVPAGLKRRLA